MPRIDLDAVLQSLSPEQDQPADRRESALLVDLIDSIDAAIARGVPRATVLARLHDGGFTMTLPTFIKALQRIRKRLGRPAPRRRPPASHSARVAASHPPSTVSTQPTPTLATSPPSRPDPAPAPTPPTDRIKSREQIKRENPTLSSVQISKLVAQQYADPVITADELEEMKRRYNPPQVRR